MYVWRRIAISKSCGIIQFCKYHFCAFTLTAKTNVVLSENISIPVTHAMYVYENKVLMSSAENRLKILY